MAIYTVAKQAQQAFPGDTYISDLKTSSKSGKIWIRFLLAVVLIAAFADFYFMQDTLALVMNWPAIDSLEYVFKGIAKNNYAEAAGEALPIVGTIIAAASMVLTYLFVGRIAGKKYKEYRAFGARNSRIEFLIALSVELIALIGFTFLRYNGELANPYSENAVMETLMMTLIMLVAAFLAILHAYYNGDSVAAERLEDARANLSEDRALFLSTFVSIAVDPVKDRDYEQREHEVDARAVESAFRLGSIASQLNGILDPADAYEFREISRLATNSYYGHETQGER